LITPYPGRTQRPQTVRIFFRYLGGGRTTREERGERSVTTQIMRTYLETGANERNKNHEGGKREIKISYNSPGGETLRKGILIHRSGTGSSPVESSTDEERGKDEL